MLLCVMILSDSESYRSFNTLGHEDNERLRAKVMLCQSVVTQISTSVQQTTEVVTLKPCALTLQATLPVPVYQDTLEMDLPAQVNINTLQTTRQSTSSLCVM